MPDVHAVRTQTRPHLRATEAQSEDEHEEEDEGEREGEAAHAQSGGGAASAAGLPAAGVQQERTAAHQDPDPQIHHPVHQRTLQHPRPAMTIFTFIYLHWKRTERVFNSPSFIDSHVEVKR